MSVVTVSPKFQVVIPRHIRVALKLEPGQKVEAGVRDADEDDAAIALDAFAAGQAGGFEPIDESGDVRHVRHHLPGNFLTRQASVAVAAQDALVLRHKVVTG